MDRMVGSPDCLEKRAGLVDEKRRLIYRIPDSQEYYFLHTRVYVCLKSILLMSPLFVCVQLQSGIGLFPS